MTITRRRFLFQAGRIRENDTEVNQALFMEEGLKDVISAHPGLDDI